MLNVRPQKRLKTGEESDAPGTSAGDTKDESTKVLEDEEDEATDKRPKLKDDIVFHQCDTTLNLLTSSFGGMLTSLSESGLQHLAAGARASAGVKSGRYMFEVTILDCSAMRGHLRVGVSSEGTEPLLGDHMKCAYFDSDGNGVLLKKRSFTTLYKLKSGDTVSVLLNLAKGGKAGTISLFRKGERLTPPQVLPEELLGVALFPTISFKGMTVSVNFAGPPRFPLPFTTRMLQEAAQADVKISPPTKASVAGKCTALFPVCLPDEGTFDWVHSFLEKNPQYVEISDRKILEWARRSGYNKVLPHLSNDNPGMIDDGTAKRLLVEAAGMQRRDIVIMEVAGTLLPSDRQHILNQLQLPQFRKVAKVMIGEPPAEFKKRMQKVNLDCRQAKLDAAHAVKVEAKEKQRMAAAAIKENERKRNEVLARAKKLQDERVRQMEEKAKSMVAAAKDGNKEETKDEAMKKEEVKEEETKEEEPEDAKEEEEDVEMDEPAPVAELTAAEKKSWVRVERTSNDIEASALSEGFRNFSFPEKEEGFDEVEYAWNNAAASIKYLADWVSEVKSNVRVDSIAPGASFNKMWLQWQRDQTRWQKAQALYVTKKSAKRLKAKAEAITEAADEKEATAPDKFFGDLRVLSGSVESLLGAQVEEALEGTDVAVFDVKEISDVGDGSPLHANFTPEDWELCKLRFKVWALVRNFPIDARDPELHGIPLEHLSFYFGVYFKETLQPKQFGVDNMQETLALIRDTCSVSKNGKVFCPMLSEDLDSFDIFVKLSRASQIDRLIRSGLGDATAAALTFKGSSTSKAPVRQAAPALFGEEIDKRIKELTASRLQSLMGNRVESNPMFAGFAGRSAIMPNPGLHRSNVMGGAGSLIQTPASMGAMAMQAQRLQAIERDMKMRQANMQGFTFKPAPQIAQMQMQTQIQTPAASTEGGLPAWAVKARNLAENARNSSSLAQAKSMAR